MVSPNAGCVLPNVVEVMSAAAELREQGNQLFEVGQFADAARCYGEALALLASENPEMEVLQVPVRLNLAAALLRLDDSMEDVIKLCNEVVALDSSNTKAFFRRGLAQQALAERSENPRPILQAARKDFLCAAKLEPTNRQVRKSLETVSKALEAPQKAEGYGLPALFRSELYADREASKPPPPPPVCSVCGHLGHKACGKASWLAQRAQWLAVPETEVAKEPESFEEDGTLSSALREIRSSNEDYECGPDLSDLSDDDREALEDCIESTERPFPRLRGPVTLTQAVRCAVEMWG